MARTPVREVEVDPRSLALATVIVVLTVAAIRLLTSAPRTLVYVALAVFLTLAADPLVALVRRHLPVDRTGGVVLVFVGLAVAVGLLALFLIPPAIRQSAQLGEQLPQVARDLGDLPFVGDELVERDVPAKVEEYVKDLPDRLSGNTAPIGDAARSIADSAVGLIATGLLATALLLDGERLAQRARALLPERRRERADRIAGLLYRAVGRYAAGSVLVAGIAGMVVLATGLILGVPLSPLAAAWVAVFDLVPQIGGAVGGIAFVALATTKSAGTGLICLAVFVVYLQLENHVISPLVVGQAVQLSPLATMLAALVGVAAGGIVGALLAVPLAGAAKLMWTEVRGTP